MYFASVPRSALYFGIFHFFRRRYIFIGMTSTVMRVLRVVDA